MFKPIDPKPDFPKLEEETLKFWEDNHIFEKSLEQTQAGKPYTFYDGPPFATGTPHYGSILPSVVKDLIPRFQTMRGRFVRRRWGWDCHGLPIEEIVERELGISGKKQIEEIGIKKFNETCRSMVMMYVAEWRKTIRRIARWVDFDHSYKTMDRDYMESVWWAFKQVYEKGLIYEGRKVLLYCPRCETPVSNFEVAMDNSYKEVTEEAVTVKFKVKDQKNTYILAWTTTPWTLPGNVALAIGADIDYVRLQVSGDRGQEFYFIAKERAGQISDSQILDSMKGSQLVGLEYEPLFDVPAVHSDKSYKVYAADFVNTEEGTGVVHTAVVYGEDDYNLGLKVGLPVVPLLDEKGIFNEKSPSLVRGQYFKASEKLIKKDLEAQGLLFEKKQHQHSYPHCWRCGTALFYNAIPAWFVNVQKVKPDLLRTNEAQMNWYPGHLKHGRYQKSVEAAPDWNISRNRYWGNPIPVWKCDDCGENTVVGSIKELGLSKNLFILSRHGEAEHNVKNISSSYPETFINNLTTKGVERARGLAQVIQDQGGVDMIFSSDLARTKQTAETVGKLLNVPVEFDMRLREYNFGVYNGKPADQFDKVFAAEKRWESFPEGGESNKQVQDRMVDFINDVNTKYNGKKILVVSHGDPIYRLLQYYGSELAYPKYATAMNLDVSIADLHRPYIDEVVLSCSKCGGKAHRVTEIFDSWFEAGSMPFAEYHYPFDQEEVFKKRFPGQFVVEYIPQTRAWFYVMHVLSQILFNSAPFENVLTTGTILAEDGTKMSKSKRNYPDPWLMIEKYGVDALRLYLVNSPVMQAEDSNFSERELGVVYRKNILILWNVFNYFVTYANEVGWEPKQVTGDRLQGTVLDQWIVAKTQELVNSVTDELDSYNTVKATRLIEECINELSTWYLRRSRGRKDEDFFGTLSHCLLVLSKVMAPVTPYMAELIYQNLNRNVGVPSVHLASWPEKKELTKEQVDNLNQMELVRILVEKGHSERKAKKINLRQPLPSVTYVSPSKDLDEGFSKILAEELNVDEAIPSPSPSAAPGEPNEPWIENISEITPEYKKRGLARELERAVQELRKKSGLKVGEMANLSYDTSDEDLKEAFLLFDTKKTYIAKILQETGGEEVEIEGKRLSLRIS
jgi:isoleucyl-tRNA synthetase